MARKEEQLDELDPSQVSLGRDVNVINKRKTPTIGVGSVIFEVLLWVLFIIPGIVFTLKKVKAKTYLEQIEQQINHDASTIDNMMEERVMRLQNMVGLLDKAIDLDKDTFTKIAAYRSGINPSDADEARNEANQQIENVARKINVALENYPDLQSHASLMKAMKENQVTQAQITAAREQYNDRVAQWNRQIFVWPTYRIVAARAGYHTRVPFSTTAEIKEQARGKFF
jgi:LemA protein